jgi:hypothetical protein
VNVDTGQFRALTARADAVDALAAEVAAIKRQMAGRQHGEDAAFAAGVALGEARRTAGGRHARPRRPRPAHLRLAGTGEGAAR